ncbi:hypothetical protein [Aeromicrobium sp. Root472D3]|uniref:hypothetical protein n=1 Tax=Aeromicrobium sp. Root472D3 TaxID=1736540 RepID=UPI0006FBFB08|nr:hypothetical protein [Aeromicrobium sp. Root472D3]KQX72411.1 hypothetical protein ASD10_15575 [Aeromicrobium sp. Root472D3]
MSNPSTAPASSTARVLVIVAFVLDAIALVFLPIILGPIGAVLGFVGYSQGEKKLGLWAGIGGIAATIIGMVLGALVYNASS